MLQIYFIKKKLESENNQTMPAYQFKNQVSNKRTNSIIQI